MAPTLPITPTLNHWTALSNEHLLTHYTTKEEVRGRHVL